MRQRLFTVLSALSLLLCMAVCIIWLRSYWSSEIFAMERWAYGPGREYFRLYGFGMDQGRFGVFWMQRDTPTTVTGQAPRVRWHHIRGGDVPLAEGRRNLGFYVHSSSPLLFSNVSVMENRGAGAPAWAVAATFTVVPTTWCWWRARRKPPCSVCTTCGYDLRATPERCPECGAVPVKASV